MQRRTYQRSFLEWCIDALPYRVSWASTILWERLQGLDFTSTIDPEEVGLDPATARPVSSSGHRYLNALLNDLNISESDAIIDIGCGKGGAMRAMLRHPFLRVDGVEASEYVAKITRANFSRLRVDKITILTMDARDFEDYDPYNYIYFYNPFPRVIMEPVIENLIRSIERVPRKLVIIYNTPACHDEIVKNGLFTQFDDYPSRGHHRIYVYSNESVSS